jgi:hypothetical protein
MLWGCFSAAWTGRLVRIKGNLLQSAQDLRPGWRFPFQQDNDPMHTAKAAQEWLRDKSLNGLEWPRQSPDLNTIEQLWRDLKIAVQWRSPFNLTELERIGREEWEKLPKYICAKYKKTRGCNRCQRCFNKLLSKGSEYLCAFYISDILFIEISKNVCLLLCHYGVLCRLMRGKKLFNPF